MYNYYVKLADVRWAIMDYIGEQTVSKYASAADCKLARDGAEGAMNALDYMQPADVVPKSEVARLQEDVDRLQDINNRQVENIKLAKQEVAREIFEEIDKLLQRDGIFMWRFDIDRYAELKKKYAEGNQ